MNGPEPGPQCAKALDDDKERAKLWMLTPAFCVAKGFREREGKKKPPPDMDIVELLRKAE